MTWRTDRYGDDPPWSPTLVRTRGDSFDVWTGWQIAPVLGRHLGSTRSVAIITALGADNLNAKSSGGSVGKLSRRHALWTGVGIAAGALMLNGNPAAASEGFRLRLRKRKEVSVVSSRNLSPQETQAQYVDLLKSSDIQNVLADSEMKAHSILPETSTALVRFGDAQESVGRAEMVQAYATESHLSDGSARFLVAVHNQSDGTVLYHSRTVLDSGAESLAAYAVHVDGWNSAAQRPQTYKVLASSHEGESLRLLTQAEQDGMIETASDPCGGCRGGVCQTGGYILSQTCYNRSDVECALAASGCVLCVFCTPWLVCLGCVITACSSALISCCNRRTAPACARCRRRC